MAQKAAKAVAKRNANTLSRTHLIALAVHGFYIFCRIVLFRASLSRNTLLLYILLSSPSVIIQIVFEKSSRPLYNKIDGESDLIRSGDDLDAQGLTVWMWDVLYWTWGCIIIVSLAGDSAWWAWAMVPIYSIWLGYRTFGDVRQGMSGIGAQSNEQKGPSMRSKRQQKLGSRSKQQVSHL